MGTHPSIYFCYWNLTKHVWSLLNPRSGHVDGHAGRLVLENVTFRVREGGRQRVLAEQVKNVHAFATGVVLEPGDDPETLAEWDKLAPVAVSYNPYKAGTFVRRKDEQPIFRAQAAVLHPDGTVTVREWKNPDPTSCPHKDRGGSTFECLWTRLNDEVYIYRRCWRCGLERHQKSEADKAGVRIKPSPTSEVVD